MPGPLMWPVSIMRLASSRCPVSNTSSSGVTPASRMSIAIASRIGGVFTNTFGPMFMLPMSSEQISGRRSSTCCTRWRGVRSVVPGPGFIGSSGSGEKRPPGPVVRLMTTSVPLDRMRSTTSA